MGRRRTVEGPRYERMLSIPLPSSPPAESTGSGILVCALNGATKLYLQPQSGIWTLEVWLESDAEPEPAPDPEPPSEIKTSYPEIEKIEGEAEGEI